MSRNVICMHVFLIFLILVAVVRFHGHLTHVMPSLGFINILFLGLIISDILFGSYSHLPSHFDIGSVFGHPFENVSLVTSAPSS